MNNAAKDPTASRIRSMIGSYLRMWRADNSPFKTEIDAHHAQQVLQMLKFAKRVKAIGVITDAVLYSYTHKVWREREHKHTQK